MAALELSHLDERLDLAPLRELLRTHALGDLQWVALDASNDSVGVRPLLGALIELLDDDHLLPRLAALEDDCDLGGLRHKSQLRAPTRFLPPNVLCRACRLRKQPSRQHGSTTVAGHGVWTYFWAFLEDLRTGGGLLTFRYGRR